MGGLFISGLRLVSFLGEIVVLFGLGLVVIGG